MLRKSLGAPVLAFALLLFVTVSLGAASFLTEEEMDYIAGRGPVQAVNVVGAAPIQFRDKQGEVQGISKQVLQTIEELTGLSFEFRLKHTPHEVWESDAELIVGIPPNYAPEGLRLSAPFLISETILFFNSALDPTDLDGKRYAAVEGGALPRGIKAENTLYFKTREESLTAVDRGKADYGYGNAYSVAFYQLQRGYNNIVTVPQGKEEREYCIGYYHADPLLISIIDKALEHVDERRIETMILDMASRIERQITPAMIAQSYGSEILFTVFGIFAVLTVTTVATYRLNGELRQRNLIYDTLSQISNEFLYEYDVKTGRLVLSEKLVERLGDEENVAYVIALMKEKLAGIEDEATFEVKIPLADGGLGVFETVNTRIKRGRAQTNSIVGKLIDISGAAAERELLIARAETDGLTGLYNASTTKQLITHSLKNREGRSLDALLVIDCDNFKKINDTHGHLTGDRVLQHIARSLKKVFRATDYIGRIGGDEFAVFMKDVPSRDFVDQKCSHLKETIEQKVDGVPASVSIGITLIAQQELYEEAFSRADAALYRMKEDKS